MDYTWIYLNLLIWAWHWRGSRSRACPVSPDGPFRSGSVFVSGSVSLPINPLPLAFCAMHRPFSYFLHMARLSPLCPSSSAELTRDLSLAEFRTFRSLASLCVLLHVMIPRNPNIQYLSLLPVVYPPLISQSPCLHYVFPSVHCTALISSVFHARVVLTTARTPPLDDEDTMKMNVFGEISSSAEAVCGGQTLDAILDLDFASVMISASRSSCRRG